MCGRFYFDNETHDILDTYIDEDECDHQHIGDYTPGQNIPVLMIKNNQLVLTPLKWGYSINKGLVINARSETLLEKKIFAEDAMKHRCIVPAKGFYEWDEHKHKFAFQSSQHKLLLMAGIYREKDKEVTIITTHANDIMKGIHSRMPLIIDNNDLHKWLQDNESLEKYLSINNDELEIVSGHKQQSLF